MASMAKVLGVYIRWNGMVEWNRDRKSAAQGKSVELGGRRMMKKKNSAPPYD